MDKPFVFKYENTISKVLSGTFCQLGENDGDNTHDVIETEVTRIFSVDMRYCKILTPVLG
eukprot:snap_masked-scaffold_22-processed-gene-4.37-mRNA-1 protein AED:1.00 eAED:1.00 QI:0/-1/0/0/-1/1/1/0/59